MTDYLGPYLLGPNDQNQGIYTGDAKKLSKDIPDGSVDMIFTDPPYARECLPLYGWLADVSPRILKGGAWAFIYGGWLAREVLDLLCAGKWDYFMTMALIHHGGHPRWWSKKLMIGFKPVYVFTNGTPTIHKWQDNLAHSDQMDKRYHAWGQGTGLAIEKIDMFTNPGDVVLDPFCGGGQVAAACIATHRRYLSFEIDPDTAAQARIRVQNTQAPLPMMQIEQAKLL